MHVERKCRSSVIKRVQLLNTVDHSVCRAVATSLDHVYHVVQTQWATHSCSVVATVTVMSLSGELLCSFGFRSRVDVVTLFVVITKTSSGEIVNLAYAICIACICIIMYC